MIELGTTSSPTADYCLVYNYYYSAVGTPTSCSMPSQATSDDDGDVNGYYYEDNVNSSLSHSTLYTYDPLNRLSTAVATGDSTYNLAFSYTADGSSGGGRFGNMTCTVNGSTQGLCPQYSFNTANNQIINSGFTYDASGDLTGDGTNTYQYDAEQHLISVNGGSTEASSYNALGQWVEQRLPGIDQDEYLYDPSGTMLGLFTADQLHWWQQYIHLGRRVIAYYWADPNIRFLHADALGTTLQVVLQNGSVWTDLAQYPWGQEWQALGTNNWDEDFAGYDHTDQFADDQYPTLFRRYDPDHGRWLTPDPLGGGLTNPQSLNRYAYALNNPTTLIDPLGLQSGTPCPVATNNGEPCYAVTSTASSGGTIYNSAEWSYLNSFWDFLNSLESYYSATVHSSGDGGGNASTSGPLPWYWQVAKNFNNCAANSASNHSLASLLHLNNIPVLGTVLGSSTAAASNLVFQTNPEVYVPAGANLAAGARAGSLIKVGAAAVRSLPTGGRSTPTQARWLRRLTVPRWRWHLPVRRSPTLLRAPP